MTGRYARWLLTVLLLTSGTPFMPCPVRANPVTRAPDTIFPAEGPDNRLGFMVSGIGDIDQDGLDDICLGAYWNSDRGEKCGKCYLWTGIPGGWAETMPAANAGMTATGDDSWDEFGKAIAPAGDMDGDGVPDFLVSAYWDEANGDLSGTTYILSGRDAPGWRNPAAGQAAITVIYGEHGSDESGRDLAGGGDVNGDGLTDFMIGSFSWFNETIQENTGAAYLLLGRPEGWPGTLTLAGADRIFNGTIRGSAAGRSLACDADIDGDGYDDILVGAPFRRVDDHVNGAAYLIRGGPVIVPGGNLPERATTMFTGMTDDHAGWDVAFIGDWNGDRRQDLAISANTHSEPDMPNCGAVYIFFGRESWPRELSVSAADIIITGGESNAVFGWSMTGPGDIDSDGRDDLWAGAPGWGSSENPQRGAAYLICGGSVTGAEPVSVSRCATIILPGENAGDKNGRSVAGAGDCDGDGLPDLLSGADCTTDQGKFSGKAYWIRPWINRPAESVTALIIATDPDCRHPVDGCLHPGDLLFLEAHTGDSGPDTRSVTIQVVGEDDPAGIRCRLARREPGIYRGFLKLSHAAANERSHRMHVRSGDRVRFRIPEFPQLDSWFPVVADDVAANLVLDPGSSVRPGDNLTLWGSIATGTYQGISRFALALIAGDNAWFFPDWTPVPPVTIVRLSPGMTAAGELLAVSIPPDATPTGDLAFAMALIDDRDGFLLDDIAWVAFRIH